jgi:hypothetical protein
VSGKPARVYCCRAPLAHARADWLDSGVASALHDALAVVVQGASFAEFADNVAGKALQGRILKNHQIAEALE